MVITLDFGSDNLSSILSETTNTNKLIYNIMDNPTTIYIFDFDDTIIKTTAKIIVRNSNDEIVRRIDTVEYNSVADHSEFLSDGDYFDFSEFNNIELVKTEKLLPAFYIMQDLIDNDDPVAIVTSREYPELIEEFLIHYNLDPNKVKIFCISEANFPLTGTDSEKKRKVIENFYMLDGFTKFYVIDDAEINVQEMKRACERFPEITVEEFDLYM